MKIGDVEVDVTKGLPLVVGDWIELEEKFGVTPQHLSGDRVSMGTLLKMATHLILKVDPALGQSVVETALRALRPVDLFAITKAISDSEVSPVNRPT